MNRLLLSLQQRLNALFISAASHRGGAKPNEAKANELVAQAVAIDLWSVNSNRPLSTCREAIEWYEGAAEGGNLDAMFLLAKHYERGCGVTKDMETAARWYKRATDKGHKEAALSLAYLYALYSDTSALQ
jgi:TPR repeat protein